MKQKILRSDFDSQPVYNQLFLAWWREEKGYIDTAEWSFGEVVELALALTQDLHFEDSDGRVFNNLLNYNEIHIGWDGEDPLDVLWYELNQKLKRRIMQYAATKVV